MGAIMDVDAMLGIHIDRNMVDIMNPSRSLRTSKGRDRRKLLTFG